MIKTINLVFCEFIYYNLYIELTCVSFLQMFEHIKLYQDGHEIQIHDNIIFNTDMFYIEDSMTIRNSILSFRKHERT